MHIVLALAELLTAAAVIGTFLLLIVLPAIHDRYTPARLRPLQAKLRGIVAQHPQGRPAADQAVQDERFEHLAMLYPEADPVTLLDLSIAEEQEAARVYVTMLAREEESEPLSLLLSEIDFHLGFVPVLTRRAIYVTKRQYGQLVDFCAFHYEAIRTPEEVFQEQGLRVVQRSMQDTSRLL